eukprot:11928293-Heterocapsa_arctica.AAC.1
MTSRRTGTEGGDLVGSDATSDSMTKLESVAVCARERDPLKELPFLPAPMAGDPGGQALGEAQLRLTQLR